MVSQTHKYGSIPGWVVSQLQFSKCLSSQAETVSSVGSHRMRGHLLRPRDNNVSTNRAARPPAATASSACSTLSLAADVALFHAWHSITANTSSHTQGKASTAVMGIHTSQAWMSCTCSQQTATIPHARMERPECVRTAIGRTEWCTYGNPPEYRSPPNCRVRTNAQDLLSPR